MIYSWKVLGEREGGFELVVCVTKQMIFMAWQWRWCIFSLRSWKSTKEKQKSVIVLSIFAIPSHHTITVTVVRDDFYFLYTRKKQKNVPTINFSKQEKKGFRGLSKEEGSRTHTSSLPTPPRSCRKMLHVTKATWEEEDEKLTHLHKTQHNGKAICVWVCGFCEGVVGGENDGRKDSTGSSLFESSSSPACCVLLWNWFCLYFLAKKRKQVGVGTSM